FQPSTYGATNAAGTVFVAPLARYSLAAAQTVLPGTGEGDFFFANQVNKNSVNTNAGQLTQGVALFNQDFNGGFLVVNDGPPGQLALLTQQINAGTPKGLTLSAADKAALNTIFSNLLPDGNFATAFP